MLINIYIVYVCMYVYIYTKVRTLEARCMEMELAAAAMAAAHDAAREEVEAGHRQQAQQAEGALALERQVHHA